ncbi:MAG: phosphatase PAP2 family protein [Propionibacteriaceae bacterium]|nr:phosphatase PAP2 family protein [Propionibacteriaceae bacterium]
MLEQAAAPRLRAPIAAGAAAVLLAGLLGLWVMRANPALDERWLHLAVGLRGPGWDELALGLNYLGGGLLGVFVVPLAGTALLGWLAGRWPAAFFLAASAASALVVQVLKAAFGRARPEEILVTADPGSFPSGHTANAAAIAVVMGLLFPRTWVWITGLLYTVLMALSRTYLGAHWLTDTLGGLLVGAGVAVLVWAAFATRLNSAAAPPRAAAEAGTDPTAGAAGPG